MELTKGVISREEALKLAPAYVDFIEDKSFNIKHDEIIIDPFSKLKKGQRVITYSDGQYVLCKVSSLNYDDWKAIDGPIVRVSNGEYSWRVDGNRYAYSV